jgi:hypothetical protein
MSVQGAFALATGSQAEVSSYKANAPVPESRGIDPTMPEGLVAIRFLLPLIGCVAALAVGWFITCDPNPLTMITVLAGVLMCSTALFNPILGVYLLIFTSGYLDLVKRLGILSDALSGIDVVVTLALAPVLFVAICGGVLYRNIMRRVWLSQWQVWLAVAITLAMGAVFFDALHDSAGVAYALKDFANSGVYLLLILVGCFLFPSVPSVQRLLTFTLVVYLPVGLYGIWQQIFGLADFEIDYLNSGFTIDITVLEDPILRTFSTLNSPHALNITMAMLSALAFFVPLSRGKRGRWQILVGLIFAVACGTTFVRAGWVLFLLAFVIWICSRWKVTTISMYAAIVVGFVLLFANADALLQSLGVVESALPQNNEMQVEAFHVATFSDRLVSFRNVMTNPAFHTWFGNRDAGLLEQDSQEYLAHDQIGQILVSYGLAGLTLFGVVLVLTLWFAHRAVFRQQDQLKREILLGLVSVELATILSGMLFGSHLGIFPVNVLFYLFASAVFTVGRNAQPPPPLVSALDSRAPAATRKAVA